MLRELARKIDGFQDWFGRGVSWIMLLMVLVVFLDVVMRYAFNTSSVFAQELEWHLFGLVYLLGVGFALLTLQAFSQSIKNFYWAMGWEQPEARVAEIH